MEYSIGQTITDYMKGNGIKQIELARMLNHDQGDLNRLLRHKSMNLDMVIRISKALKFNFLDDLSLQLTSEIIEEEQSLKQEKPI